MNGSAQRLLARAEDRRGVAVVGAVVLPALLTILLVPLRTTAADAVVVLLLVALVTMLAAVGGRTAAWVATAVGALGYDVLHATPFDRLAMDDPDEVQVLVVFLVVGAVLGQLVDAAIRAATAQRDSHVRDARLLRVLVLADDVPADEVVAHVLREVRDETGAHGVAYVPAPAEGDLPHGDREGRLVRDGRALRAGQALAGPWLLSVERHGVGHGHLEVHGDDVPERARVVEAWTLAALLGAELCARPDDAAAPATAGTVPEPRTPEPVG